MKNLPVSAKLTLLTLGSVLLALLLVGASVNYVMRDLLRGNAREALDHELMDFSSFVQTTGERLDAQAGEIASNNAVTATLNLVERYERAEDYNAILFDEEKKKVYRRLAQRVQSRIADEILIFDPRCRIVVFALQGDQGYAGGISTYVDGERALRLHDRESDEWEVDKTPQSNLDNLCRKETPLEAPHFHFHEGVLSLTYLQPVIRHLPSGGTQRLGGALLLRRLNEAYFEAHNAQNIVHFALETQPPEPGAAATENDPAFHRVQRLPVHESRAVYLHATYPRDLYERAASGTSYTVLVVMLISAFIVIPFSLWVSRKFISNPLLRLLAMVDDFRGGRYEAQLVVEGNDEFGKLASAMNHMGSEVKDREQELSAIVENIPQMVFVKDADTLSFFTVNSAFEQLTGLSRDQALGQNDYAFFPREQADFFTRKDREVLARGEVLDIPEEPLDTTSGRRILHTRKVPVRDQQGKARFLLGVSDDITERKAAERALIESNQRFAAILETTRDGFLVTSTEGRILETNDAYCRMSRYAREELLSKGIPDLEAAESLEETKRHLQTIAEKGNDLFESWHRRKDGTLWPLEASVSYTPMQNGRYFSFLRDITERKQNEVLTSLREELAELLYKGDRDRIMRRALDTAERVTQSQIGFFHFVEKDRETVSLQVWSTRTLKEMCYAEGHGLHYPISEAGVWVDCIQQKRAVIHNDYESLPHKKGLPEGHAKLLRELVVPVFRGGLIVAVMGVGNKAHAYDASDESLVGRVADMTHDFVERKDAEQRIEYMAYYDVLTGLPNRELLMDRLNQAIAQSRRSKQTLAVCYLDLDGFKPINDQYGHHIGDALLVKLAARLKENLREGDTLGRLGGDEFVLLLNNLTSMYDGEQIIHRILQSINEPFELFDHRILISGSIGATVYPMDKGDADTLLRHADQAMYKAKASGKSSFKLYDPLQDHKVHVHRQALEEFERALQNSELRLHYQPKIDLGTGEVKGLEALVRWQHPNRGMVPPGHFLPLIEGSPEEFLLGEWVLKTALDQHMAWREQGTRLPLSVNITPRHIQLRGFVEFLTKLLTGYPDDVARHLELEVLETAAIGDTARVAEVMSACADLGVQFSLDDFGTGYSSLTYFHRLPINVLKIDQNFVRNMMDDVGDLDIVEGVLRLSEALNRPVVAEGVENIEIGMMLLQLGCRYAQGYGIARPMPADEVIGWLGKWVGSSPWHRLKNETEGKPEMFDLNVSIFSHRHWLDEVIRGIETEDLSTLPKLGEHHCQFGRWYSGIGQARYGNHPSFPFVKPKHSQIHQLASGIVADMKHGDGTSATTQLAELKQRGQELIALLKGLATK
jgi:diguanylate cyclase (GGDEF)-like protein/PAS domain S-box-containing protein